MSSKAATIRLVPALLLLALGAPPAAAAQEHPVKRVANIVSVALEEYAKGVDDRGRLISAQEYQEAVDFLQDARRTAERLPGLGAITARALLDSIVLAVQAKRPPSALAGLQKRFAAPPGSEGASKLPPAPIDL